MMYALYVLIEAVSAAPLLLGAILIGVRVRGSARVLGVAGCVIMLISLALGVAKTLLYATIYHRLGASTANSPIPGTILGLIYTAGLTLAICAVVARRTGSEPATSPAAG
jgi:hypothetical protein